jgi:Lantibiotic biosynthesis dehydratase C-term
MALNNHDLERWVFWKIYPSRFEQLDDVLHQIVSPLVAEIRRTSRLERWFFIRYVDERGWHIRLRMCGPPEEHEQWSRKLEALVSDRLYSLPVPAGTQKQLIPNTSVGQKLTDPGYTTAFYEPEYEKYGGLHGMAIAEEFFQSSSDLVLDLLGQLPDELNQSSSESGTQATAEEKRAACFLKAFVASAD